MRQIKRVPSRYQPSGFRIIYEDEAIIVGEKAVGVLSVGANYDRTHTVHHALNQYIRKGNSRSHKCVFVVHRLDRETSGLMVFAKTQHAQATLKDNWTQNKKIYATLVYGRPPKDSGIVESYLVEDDKYRVHSLETVAEGEGKLARTAYTLEKSSGRFSLLKIELLTGRKNQVRVHMAGLGCPVVGDDKYGRPGERPARLMLHSHMLSLVHPVTRERLEFTAPLPLIFSKMIGGH